MQTHGLKESTWQNDWDKIFKRLDPKQPVTTKVLLSLVLQTERDSRNRRRLATSYSAWLVTSV